jgi:hypothetical protein
MQEYIVKVYDDRTEWYQNGKYHRLDGPAIECKSGTRIWYQNNELHRLDGPAIECKNGIKEWWIEGTKYTEEEFKQKTEKNCIENKVVEIEGKKYKLVSI